jgi:predicted RNA-binding protein (virulence factor B family)
MINLGRYNNLTITALLDDGCLLDGGTSGGIKLKEIGQFQIGDDMYVFVYINSEGEFAATTTTPLAQVGEVAWLKIVAIDDVGAFLDWGLPKDLFLPYSEQRSTLKEGNFCLVKIYLDNSNRIAATTRLDKHLLEEAPAYKTGQAVSIFIADKTELGVKVVIDHQYWGLLYENEIYQPVKKGQQLTAYIKRVRSDKKLDLSLQQPGYGKIDDIAQGVLEKLKDNDGLMMISDKSSPEAIKAIFGISKKVFKQAIGSLYKQRIITIDNKSIKLTKDKP